MKIIFFLPIFTFLIVCNVFSQNKKQYKFDKIYTKRQLLKGAEFLKIYEVSNSSVSGIKKVGIKNTEYAKLENQISKAVEDSILETAEYNEALDKFNSLLTIKEKVKAFNTSNKSFDVKKMFLKEAQVLASKYAIKDLLYADNTINKSLKTRFLILSLNGTEMKVHLNKILWKLNDIKAPEAKVFNSTIVLNDLREKISKTKRMHYVNKKYNVNGLKMLAPKIEPSHLLGSFKVIGRYAVIRVATNNFKENQLITKGSVLKLKIGPSKLYSNVGDLLIENKETKKRYLVDANFLDVFSLKESHSISSF